MDGRSIAPPPVPMADYERSLATLALRGLWMLRKETRSLVSPITPTSASHVHGLPMVDTWLQEIRIELFRSGTLARGINRLKSSPLNWLAFVPCNSRPWAGANRCSCWPNLLTLCPSWMPSLSKVGNSLTFSGKLVEPALSLMAPNFLLRIRMGILVASSNSIESGIMGDMGGGDMGLDDGVLWRRRMSRRLRMVASMLTWVRRPPGLITHPTDSSSGISSYDVSCFEGSLTVAIWRSEFWLISHGARRWERMDLCGWTLSSRRVVYDYYMI